MNGMIDLREAAKTLHDFLKIFGLEPTSLPPGQTGSDTEIFAIAEILGVAHGFVSEALEYFGDHVADQYGPDMWVDMMGMAMSASTGVTRSDAADATVESGVVRARLGAMALDRAMRQASASSVTTICGDVAEALMWSCNAAQTIMGPDDDDSGEVLVRTMELRDQALRAALDHTPGHDMTGHDDTVDTPDSQD